MNKQTGPKIPMMAGAAVSGHLRPTSSTATGESNRPPTNESPPVRSCCYPAPHVSKCLSASGISFDPSAGSQCRGLYTVSPASITLLAPEI